MTDAATVTAADQQQINKFARLHTSFMQLKEEMSELSNELQNINEAADELLLLDDEDAASVPMRFGQTFVHFDSEAMGEKLEKKKGAAEAKLDSKKAESAGIQNEMDVLKKTLYAKFGDRINLEADKDD